MENPVPRHVAIIMDGNGRWAKERNLPRAAGHKAGIETVREIVKASENIGISVLTLYAFSQENWKRPREEVAVLMELLEFFIDKELKDYLNRGVRLRTIGHIEALPPTTLAKVRQAVQDTRHNDRFLLNIALNYGSRTEILDAVYGVVQESKDHPDRLASREALTEEVFEKHLDTRGLPDPDLLIRTSGEMRVSNFLLWQISYSELYISPKFWPDFKKEDYIEAIRLYQARERRFGDIGQMREPQKEAVR